MDADVQEVLRRSSVAWVALDGAVPRAVWHVWNGDALHVVTGPGEQQLPGASTATRATVVLRGAGSLAGAVAELDCTVERVAAGTSEWDAVAPVVATARLNGPDPAALVERWARGAVLLRLRPS